MKEEYKLLSEEDLRVVELFDKNVVEQIRPEVLSLTNGQAEFIREFLLKVSRSIRKNEI